MNVQGLDDLKPGQQIPDSQILEHELQGLFLQKGAFSSIKADYFQG